jgi:hypothetical protein
MLRAAAGQILLDEAAPWVEHASEARPAAELPGVWSMRMLNA